MQCQLICLTKGSRGFQTVLGFKYIFVYDLCLNSVCVFLYVIHSVCPFQRTFNILLCLFKWLPAQNTVNLIR